MGANYLADFVAACRAQPAAFLKFVSIYQAKKKAGGPKVSGTGRIQCSAVTHRLDMKGFTPMGDVAAAGTNF